VLQEFSPAFTDDIFSYLIPRRSVERKRSAGSTAPGEVERQIEAWKGRLEG
jgi:argininosuccinate lyase